MMIVEFLFLDINILGFCLWWDDVDFKKNEIEFIIF